MAWREAILRHFGPGLLGGITLGDWLRLLRENRFAVAPSRIPRALAITVHAAQNSALPLDRPPSHRPGPRGRGRRAAPVPARPLAERHDAPAQPAGGRRAVRLPDHLPGPLPPHVPHHRGDELAPDGLLPAEGAADGQRRVEHGVAPGGRVRPLRREPHVAVHGLDLPRAAGALRPLPDLPRRPRGRGPALARGVPAVPAEAHLEVRPPARPEVAAAHRPDPAPAGDVPAGQVRPHPPRPVRRLPVEPEDVPGERPAERPPASPGRRRGLGPAASTGRCTTRSSRSAA